MFLWRRYWFRDCINSLNRRKTKSKRIKSNQVQKIGSSSKLAWEDIKRRRYSSIHAKALSASLSQTDFISLTSHYFRISNFTTWNPDFFLGNLKRLGGKKPTRLPHLITSLTLQYTLLITHKFTTRKTSWIVQGVNWKHISIGKSLI